MKKLMIFLMTITVLALFLGGGFLYGLRSMVNPNPGEITADRHWYNKRYPEAIDVAKRMAAYGDPWAELRMGAYYMFGQGVPQDDQIAMFWLKKASVHYDDSRWSQGKLFSHGLPGHFGENQDALNAQYNLSVFFRKGEVVSKDLELAYLYQRNVLRELDMAGRNSIAFCCTEIVGGDGISLPRDFLQEAFDLTLSMMTTEEIAQAEEAFVDWKPPAP